jgi:hypothetical protein
MNPCDENNGSFARADGPIRRSASRNLDEMIRKAASHEPPQDLALRVKAKLENERRLSVRLGHVGWSRAALAACVATAAIALGAVMGSSVSDILQQRVQSSAVELWESDSGEGFADLLSENGVEEKTQ